MTRKRFIKLSMSQECSKRVAVWTANYVRKRWGCYQTGWVELYGIISGRFEMYVK